MTSIDPAEAVRLSNLIDQAAIQLHENLSGGYIDGYELQLTDRVINDYLRDAESDDHTTAVDHAIAVLLHEQMGGVISGNCLLDETQPLAYRTAGIMADVLHAAIGAEHNEEDALRRLVADEISERQKEYTRRVEVVRQANGAIAKTAA